MTQDFADIPLPKTWPEHARSAIIHVISLAHAAIVCARGWAANSSIARVRLRGQLEKARAEISLLTEELRIKDARMASLDPRRRPHYRPTERLAILELRAARGWSMAQTARALLVVPATIASWCKRVDEEGESALVQTPEPVNKYPAFVRHIVSRLKVLQPTMGKKRIAQVLARAGLHIGATTVKRMLEWERGRPPTGVGEQAAEEKANQPLTEAEKRPNKPVKSTRPDHVWEIDLTLVPTSAGFWVSWLPFSLPQRWPFCWWVVCLIDHFSRRVVGFAVFTNQPTSALVRSFLGRAIGKVGRAPRYLISDLGGQFDCDGYRNWCKRKGIKERYSSKGSLAATAMIERFFRSLKEEMLRRGVVPLNRAELLALLTSYLGWYHENRPHQGLNGCTPNEVYFGENPANEKPRIEPRAKWPRRSPCAQPTARVRGRRGQVVELVLQHHDADNRLPIVELRAAA
ncbi:transposase [Myxococcota bacterium]